MTSDEVQVDSVGNQHWYLNGNLHRSDGPAIIFVSGQHFWYLNGNRYSDKKRYQIDAKLCDEDMTLLLLRYNFE